MLPLGSSEPGLGSQKRHNPTNQQLHVALGMTYNRMNDGHFPLGLSAVRQGDGSVEIDKQLFFPVAK